MSGWPVALPEDICFVDNDLAVVRKRVGELCQDNSPRSLSQRMRPRIEFILGHPVRFCQCVHRLDQPVSGLCILGLTEKSLAALSKNFARRAVKKTYCAITERPHQVIGDSTVPREDSEVACESWQQLDCYMVFDQKNRRARIVPPGNGGGKKALLRYKVMGHGERYDFILVEPETGRSHQIRCQLASIGRPIKGDLKYGAKRSERGGGIRLHAYKLEFTHPVTGQELAFICNPPDEDSLWRSCSGFLCR